MHPLKPHRVVCQFGATHLAFDSHANTAFESAQNEGWLTVMPSLRSALWLGRVGQAATLGADAAVRQADAKTPAGD